MPTFFCQLCWTNGALMLYANVSCELYIAIGKVKTETFYLAIFWQKKFDFVSFRWPFSLLLWSRLKIFQHLLDRLLWNCAKSWSEWLLWLSDFPPHHQQSHICGSEWNVSTLLDELPWNVVQKPLRPSWNKRNLASHQVTVELLIPRGRSLSEDSSVVCL